VERELTEAVPVEAGADVDTFDRLFPLQRSEIEQLVRRPVRKEAEEIAQVRPGLDVA
jgi:hypothetical protein